MWCFPLNNVFFYIMFTKCFITNISGELKRSFDYRANQDCQIEVDRLNFTSYLRSLFRMSLQDFVDLVDVSNITHLNVQSIICIGLLELIRIVKL